MIPIFKPDRFSDSKPQWNTAGEDTIALMSQLTRSISNTIGQWDDIVQQSGSLEINSSNFLIGTDRGQWLVKRWPHNSNLDNVTKKLRLMTWLHGEGVPAPRPVILSDQSYALSLNDSIYSFFEFIDGNYFDGTDSQLRNTAISTVHLHHILSTASENMTLMNGPEYFSEIDGNILNQMSAQQKNWDKLFGQENANLISESWEELAGNWKRIQNTPPSPGPLQMAHFDLHPHNILMNDDEVAAFLDFDSCMMMPVGYALAFNAMKQCRQTATAQNIKSVRILGKDYQEIISQHYPSVAPSLCDLALSEVLRRLCLIFRLNLQDQNSQWNKVLPIQLAHLKETKALFF